MRRRRIIRPQRAPVFIGCEGQSEISYASWLRNIIRDRNLPFHLELSDLGRGAGDPFARIDMAIERVNKLEANKQPFIARYLFLDTDQLGIDRDRAEQAHRRARDHNFVVIWQDPTHEAFLLRHFPGRDTRQPPDKRSADAALSREWADYRKPCSAQQLELRLQIDGAHRVAARLPNLADLLGTIGLLD